MITRKDIIDCFIYGSNINKPLFDETGFIVSDNNNSFSFSCPRNTGKTTFLIKFLIDDFLNVKLPKKYIYISHTMINGKYVNEMIIRYMNQLNIINTIQERKSDYISLKNGCEIYFDIKLNRNMDVLIIDDADYYLNGLETDLTLLYNISLFSKNKNKRVILSSSNSDLNKLNTNESEYINIIDKLKLPHYNLSSEKIKLYIRLNKIEKIKCRMNV